MNFSLSQAHNHNVNDMDFTFPGVSLPESDIRSSSRQQQPLYQYLDPSQSDFAFHHDFLAPNSDHNHHILPGSTADPSCSHLVSDQELAVALASYQPCDDCTPATKTIIPHHHHAPGRLTGASAQLDGHFCCSWLVHGQPCFLCFESAEALDNHIKNDHAGKDGTYRCLWQSCSKPDHSTKTSGPTNFGNKPKLMRHVHSHTGYKPFPCPYEGCDKGFVTKEQLKNHETTHTKDRKFKCNQCDKAFAVKSALTTHIAAVHEDKKTHKCEVCGKAFADSSNMSKHKQTHYRDGGIRRQRRRRGTSSVASTRSSPSIPTPTPDPATPFLQLPPGVHDLVAPPISPNLMPPPAPKLSAPSSFVAAAPLPVSYSTMSLTSPTSSPPPESFDPDCYCCEQRCPPSEGVPTPCDEADDCARDGFCDLPQCSPEAAPSPCTMAEDCCDRAGCCDLPECLAENPHGSPHAAVTTYQYDEPILSHHQQADQLRSFQLPQQHWDDWMDGGGFLEHHRAYSQLELEEQFTHMHGD